MKEHKNLWTVVGNAKQVVNQISIYFSVYSMLATSLILWHTTLNPILTVRGITISIWWFVLLLAVIFTTLAVIEWKRSMPGFFRSWIQQFYTKDNPLRQSMERQEEKLDRLEKMINELKNLK